MRRTGHSTPPGFAYPTLIIRTPTLTFLEGEKGQTFKGGGRFSRRCFFAFPGNYSISEAQILAENLRKPQIFAENRRKPQLALLILTSTFIFSTACTTPFPFSCSFPEKCQEKWNFSAIFPHFRSAAIFHFFPFFFLFGPVFHCVCQPLVIAILRFSCTTLMAHCSLKKARISMETEGTPLQRRTVNALRSISKTKWQSRAKHHIDP